MKLSHFFIDRPIFASVISIFLVIIGALSYLSLPVAQYPEIAPPTISVSAVYPGANAETVAATVATPLEQEINGVENMIYMSSQSTGDGAMQLRVTFELGTDLEQAQVLVQNRVAVAEPRLPEEVRRLGITTQKSAPDLLMVIHMLSPGAALDALYISNYTLLQVRDVLARIDGVGSIQVFGARNYSMRIWMDPDKMQARELTASDVVGALREQNVQIAGGVLGQPPVTSPVAFQQSIQLQGRLTDIEQFENIIVKSAPGGQITRVRDVARVELGAQEYVTNSYLSGSPAVAIAISQRPGSNALETAANLQDAMQRLAEDFPDGLDYQIVYNPTEFIDQSIQELIRTIFEALLLVVLVVFVFLQSGRAAIIPVIAIPVSLIGTFAVMAAFGFSINNLTLFGLVLAVGVVVDDAIVVVENIERNIADGLAPKEAARKAMTEVGSALIATTLVLAAVFVPTAFVGGISGQFYQQFALTIAVATVISTVNSLTLSPALGAMLLRADKESSSLLGKPFQLFFRGFNRVFDAFTAGYTAIVRTVVKISLPMMVIYAGLIALTVWGFSKVPTGFIPQQDQGYLITVVQLPPGASLGRTDAVVKRAAKILRETPGIVDTVSFAGFNGATFTNASNAGAIFAVTAPFSDRMTPDLSAGEIIRNAQVRLAGIQEAFIFVIPPPPVQGIGNAGGFKMMVQDRRGRGIGALQQATNRLAAAANADPNLVGVFTPFQTGSPQLFVDIDRTKAEQLNIPLSTVFSTLEIYLGSVFVNDFNLFGRTYRVTAQGEEEDRRTPDDIANLRVRSSDGAMVPIGSFADFSLTAGPDRVPRYNLYPTAEVQGNPMPGVSTGEALDRMEQLAEQVLPFGFSFEWTELSFQQRQAEAGVMLIFMLCVLFVFLVLAAQYESWTLPISIILIVPMCLLSAIAGIALLGKDNNILTQIGFVVLVGLASKNAILIVEFARQLERDGKDRFEAAIEACQLRLRPIMMTAFSFILGVVPLVVATGAGAEMRQALGTAVFFGMLGVTFFGLLFTPAFYVLVRRFASDQRKARREAKLAARTAD